MIESNHAHNKNSMTRHKPKKDKQTIFILFDNFSLGGIQQKITLLGRFLDTPEYHHISSYYIFNTKTSFSYKKDVTNKQVHIYYEKKLPLFQRFQQIFYIAQVTALIMKYNPDVIVQFEYQNLPALYWIKKIIFWKKLHIVISQETMISSYCKSLQISTEYPVSFFKKYFAIAEKIIVPTEKIKTDLINVYHQKKNTITIVPNGLCNTTYYHQKSKKFDCIYMGRFAKEKNLPRLITILSQVKKQYNTIQLLLLGEGDELSTIEKAIQKYDLSQNVTIHTSVHDISPYISQSKIFVLTSKIEGLPFALLEAMNQKLPPVVLEYPGVYGCLSHNKNALIAKNNNQMANYIITLLKNNMKREFIASNARKTILSNYNKNCFRLFIDTLLSIH